MPKPIMWSVCPKCHQRSGQPLLMSNAPGGLYRECENCGHIWKEDDPPRLPPRKP